MISLSYGMHRCIVRKVMIRPIAIFEFNEDGFANAQAQVIMSAHEQVVPVIPTFNMNLMQRVALDIRNM